MSRPRMNQDAETPTELVKEELEDLRRRFVECREALGISQSDLARETGTTRGYIFRIEKGEVKPSLGLLILICKNYSISLDWLVLGRGVMSVTSIPANEVVPAIAKDLHDVRRTLEQINTRLQEAGVRTEF